MNDIVIMVPSRGRPDRFAECLDAWERTTVRLPGPRVWMAALLDADDSTVSSYPLIPDDIGWYVLDTPNGFAPRQNVEGLLLARAGDKMAIGSWGDDHLPRTHGWDALLVAAIDSLGSGVYYPDDGWQHEELPTAPIITSDIVAALGWYSPPGLQHAYVDNFWRSLGIMLGRLNYCADLLVEHMHPDVPLGGIPRTAADNIGTKAPRDATYERVTNAVQVADYFEWKRYQRAELRADVDRVLDALGRKPRSVTA